MTNLAMHVITVGRDGTRLAGRVGAYTIPDSGWTSAWEFQEDARSRDPTAVATPWGIRVEYPLATVEIVLYPALGYPC